MSPRSLRNGLVTFALLLVLVGCENEGPLERAGEEVDEAVEDVRAGGETVGNTIDDAVDEAEDAVDEVRRDLE